MYESFYGLTDRPFSLTPNPRFVYRSRQFKDAEAQLAYGVRGREGLMLLTGESGSGKTTLCRALVETLSRSQMQCAFIATPLEDGSDVLAALLTEFGVSVPSGATRRELLDRLNQFLRAQLALGRTCIAIFDEAHLQPPEVFEQLRVLSNLETDEEKLIQIILAGQPVLLDRIRTPQMSQLDQRVSVRCALRELDEEETGAYIHHRLDIAGADGRIRFANRSLGDVYRASHGVPRLINLIGDRALLAGFAANSRDIAADHVAKSVAALRGAEGASVVAAAPERGRRTRGRAAAVGAVAVVLVTAAASAGVMKWPRASHAAPQPADEVSYTRAVAVQNPAAADSALRAFITDFPASRHHDDALLRLADVEQSRGDIAGAIEHLTAVAEHEPTGPMRTRAVVLASSAILVTGDSVGACARIVGDSSLVVTGDSTLTSQLESLSSTCAARATVSTPAPGLSKPSDVIVDTSTKAAPTVPKQPSAAAKPTPSSAPTSVPSPALSSTPSSAPTAASSTAKSPAPAASKSASATTSKSTPSSASKAPSAIERSPSPTAGATSALRTAPGKPSPLAEKQPTSTDKQVAEAQTATIPAAEQQAPSGDAIATATSNLPSAAARKRATAAARKPAASNRRNSAVIVPKLPLVPTITMTPPPLTSTPSATTPPSTSPIPPRTR